MTELKTCTKCRKRKLLSAYYTNCHAKDGLQAWCKLCIKERNRQKYLKSPMYFRSLERKWRTTNPEGFRQYKQRQKAKKYGITFEALEALEKKANKRCQICACETKLHVDHCHTTKKVRGLLCSPCNKGLGMFYDSIDSLKKAIHYLKRT